MSEAPAVVANMSLGLVRALGREGVPVYALDPDPQTVGMNSRYCTPVVAPNIRKDENDFIEFLLEFGRKLPTKAVLYPTGDPHGPALLPSTRGAFGVLPLRGSRR